tara:strand:- start:360 stop:1088 length:729 start_codon:yes stop_codon:yes gene_type:complete
MGRENFEFLLRTRDKIVKSESRILKIDSDFLSNERKIAQLMFEKKYDLILPKNENWRAEIEKKYQEEFEKFEDERKRQLLSLEAELLLVSKEEKETERYLKIGGILIICSLISFVGVFAWDYFNSYQNLKEIFQWIGFSFVNICWIYWFFWMLLLSKGHVEEHNSRNISADIESLRIERPYINNRLDARKAEYILNISRDKKIQNELDVLRTQQETLIQEKELIAKNIIKSWEDVSHLIPKN